MVFYFVYMYVVACNYGYTYIHTYVNCASIETQYIKQLTILTMSKTFYRWTMNQTTRNDIEIVFTSDGIRALKCMVAINESC